MILRASLAASVLGAALLVSPVAKAQEARPIQTTQYPAPLSQTTQPSYVPQSVALSGPKEIAGDEDQRVPPGYTAVERTRKGPIIGGAVTFGSVYLLTALGASIAEDASSGSATALFLPGLGPFIQMGKTDTATGQFFLAVDGVAQCAGLALLIYGLSSKKTVFVRNDLVVAPIVTGSSAGAGLTGTF